MQYNSLMSGHSKWATIHRQKAVKDQARGQVFTKLAKAVTIAAKTGGGPNPDTNYKLRMAIDAARAGNMPKENIERAIGKATSAGEELYEALYEGFSPGGAGILVEVATDNRNRTGQEIKRLFEDHGGRFAGPGAVSFNFDQRALFFLEKAEDIDTQTLELIDLGALDVVDEEDGLEVYGETTSFSQMRVAIEEKGYKIKNAEVVMVAKNTIELSPEDLEKTHTLLGELTDHEDVQKVFSNI